VLREQIQDLAARVRRACKESLEKIMGPERVTELPEPPRATDLEGLPEPPPLDDPEAMEKWTSLIVELSEDRGRQEGLREGRQEGLREGEARGRRRLILQQLETKFGAPLPAEKRSQLQHGTDEELDEWAKRLLTAASLEDVFG